MQTIPINFIGKTLAPQLYTVLRQRLAPEERELLACYAWCSYVLEKRPDMLPDAVEWLSACIAALEDHSSTSNLDASS